MPKPTLVPTIALSLALTLACQPAEEPAEAPSEGQEAVEETEPIPPPDSMTESVGGNWIVRAEHGRACVSVPPSAVPPGQTWDVTIKRGEINPPFPQNRTYPPVYEFSVTDQNGNPVEFADSVVFAICVNYPGPDPLPADMKILRAASSTTLDTLPRVAVPDGCHLTCPHPAVSAESAPLLDRLFGGSPVTATSARAAVYQEGLGGKGRTTSPFAGVDLSSGAAGN